MTKKILIVEDEQDLVVLLTKRLMKEGYDVDWVAHGSVAASKVKEIRPNLLILDLMLPGKDGLTILREVREIDAALPVLVMTGMQNPAYKKQVLDAGVQGYFQKPYESQDVMAIIRKILSAS